MGFFSRRQVGEPSDLPTTQLDSQWFLVWAQDIVARVGIKALETRFGLQSDVDVLATLWGKAIAVIDHDCRDYVQRYCGADSLRTYTRFLGSDSVTCWDLTSLVVSLNPKDGWESFIVDDMKSKLARFTEILVSSF